MTGRTPNVGFMGLRPKATHLPHGTSTTAGDDKASRAGRTNLEIKVPRRLGLLPT